MPWWGWLLAYVAAVAFMIRWFQVNVPRDDFGEGWEEERRARRRRMAVLEALEEDDQHVERLRDRRSQGNLASRVE